MKPIGTQKGPKETFYQGLYPRSTIWSAFGLYMKPHMDPNVGFGSIHFFADCWTLHGSQRGQGFQHGPYMELNLDLAWATFETPQRSKPKCSSHTFENFGFRQI